DLEMPGPAKTFGAHLQDAVNKGDVPVSIINDKCRRLLRTLVLTGRLDRQEMAPLAEKSGASPATCQLIRQTAAQGMVLLKNQGVLPIDIDKGEIKKIAVIGPNAAVARIQGGGSAGVNSPHAVSPLQGIREACGNQVKVLYAEGCTNHKRVPLLDTKMLTPSQGGEGQGFEVRYYNNLDFSGAPVETRIVRRSEFFWFGRFSDLVDPQCFSARMEASLTPSQTCRWQISLASAGLSRLWIDDELFINNWEDQEPGDIYFSKGSTEVIREVALEAGRDYRLRLDYSTAHSGFVAGLRVGMMPLSETDPVAEAVSLAVESDLVILCAGLNSEWDTEGYDRPDMSLPGDQVRLIRSVAQANENTVVVLNNGSAVAMHEWIMDVRAVLEAWYPGQEAGHALADILLGKVNPSGRLTQTFPLRIEDAPAMCRPPHSYPGVKGSVIYEEALLVGYRYYDYHDLMPLFPFGHGLSYTEFDYNDLSLDKSLYAIGDDVHIRFTVANKGDRAGAEVVQLYVGAMELQEGEPVQTLKGFSKLFLMPGECKTVEMSIGFRDLAFWNVQTKNWEQAPGEYALRIGASSRDLRLAAVCRFVTA
ncbi:MAG: glycoside hydrolase family 3 C-terminal domain-containing protein, partial [Gammaproteobacteria bacterium]|nr:glycoside hydrolase family 3 C-terminal domain-containing protein [Gammaproteobacteria bacterium]